jgi:NAD(P)H dehydrogenase (quinone)
MKKTLIINCHPNKNSYNHAIANAYKKGAKSSSKPIDEIIISDLKFNPILEFGYQTKTELEPDLLMAWDKIKAADHLVIVMPIWWGAMPGIAKCFFERLFLPGMAFKYRKNSPFWDKLLVGKTAQIIVTMDTPWWYFKFVYSNVGIKQLKNNILNFCGITVLKTISISPIRNSTEEFRKNWLIKIEDLAKK